MRKITAPLPTAEQIANLNALLRESEVRARQINYPLSILAPLSVSYLFDSWIIKAIQYSAIFVANVLGIFSPENINPFVYYSSTVLLLFTYYKVFQKTASHMLSVFPHGVGYGSASHRAYKVQEKLGTRELVKNTTDSLQKLITAQKNNRNILLYVYLIATIALPLLSPRASPEDYRGSPMISVLAFIAEILLWQPVLNAFNFIYNKWESFNLEENINSFKKNIQSISCLKGASRIRINLLNKVDLKEAAMCSIEPPKIISFTDSGQNYTISIENYLIELHRLLIEENVSSYLALENRKIFVGYSDLICAQADKIREKLLMKLIEIAKHEWQTRQTTQLLEKKVRLHRESFWESHTTRDKHGNLKTYHWTNDQGVSGELTKASVGHKKKNNYVLIKTSSAAQAPENITDAGKVEDKSAKKSFYPERISFSQNIFFDRKRYGKQGQECPKNFAYPIRVPWLSEGRGYGSVDPRVFGILKEHLDEKQIIAPLVNGEVHGKSAYHTKAGSVGIHTHPGEIYKGVDGRMHESSFKLKFGNNIRIFGYKHETVDVDGKKRIHYVFNGPGYGH